MGKAKQIIILVVIVVAVYFLASNWNEIYGKTTNFLSNTRSNSLGTQNPAEQKCIQAVNDKISFLNQKYNPSGIFSLVDVKEFSTIETAKAYVGQWRTGSMSADFNAERALSDISGHCSPVLLGCNSTVSQPILPIYIGTIKMVGTGPYGSTDIFFLVCDTNGNPLPNTSTLS
jgi:hypothetical protein